METENKDWKPEVGKTAWAVNRRSLAVVECVINAIYGTEPYVVADVSSRTRGGSWLDKAMVVYPTAEAALAANPLKVYDLEGKEVVIPPRPLVLEPKPLEWHHRDMNEEAFASYDDWAFYAWYDGDWEIRYDVDRIGGGETKDGNFDTAKAAIHEWRVNHLKSMLP